MLVMKKQIVTFKAIKTLTTLIKCTIIITNKINMRLPFGYVIEKALLK